METDGGDGDDDGDKQHLELVQDLVQTGVSGIIEACVPVLGLVRHMLHKNVEVDADLDISVYAYLSLSNPLYLKLEVTRIQQFLRILYYWICASQLTRLLMEARVAE